MRVARFHGEKTLDDLVARLYSFGETGTTPAEAGRRLLSANPHLRVTKSGVMRERLEHGTVIAVPDVDGAPSTEATERMDDAMAEALHRQIAGIVTRVGLQLDAGRQPVRDELKTTLQLIESDEVHQAAKQDPEVAARLDRTRDEALAALTRLDAAADRERRALEMSQQAAERLLKLLARRG
ncbi:hypothetical protein [Geodermatophilus sp. URMC 62]|uniref:hypothetical protein n=1 Tax=Geodermatophilus sp. URMC 62 TaxID=3423414 RepID=UPI00406CF29F